jgi:hypothetical protein
VKLLYVGKGGSTGGSVIESLLDMRLNDDCDRNPRFPEENCWDLSDDRFAAFV